jgi:hypothetical protein
VAEAKKGIFVDLLDRSFAVMGRTWPTTLLLGAVLFFPTSWFFGWAYARLFDVLSRTMGAPGKELAGSLGPLGLAYLWIILAALAQGLVFLFVRACVAAHAVQAVRGRPATPFTVIPGIFREKYPRLLGQRVLQWAIIGVTLAAGSALAGVGIGVPVAFKLYALAVVLGVVLVLGTLVVYAWLSIRFSLTLEAVVVDDAKIEQSLDASAAAIRGDWWRVFAITLLFALMVSFATSLLVTPILFFAGLREYGELLRSMLDSRSEPGSFNHTFMRLIAGMGKKIGLMAYLQSLLTSFVTPVFMTLLYLAMKKRRAAARGGQ